MRDQSTGQPHGGNENGAPSTPSEGGPGDESSAAPPSNGGQPSGTGSGDGSSGNADGGSASDGGADGGSGSPDDDRSDWCTGDGCIPDSHLPVLVTEFSQKSDIIYNVPSRCVLQCDVINDCTVPVRMRTTLSLSIPASSVSVSALRGDGKVVPMTATSSSWLGSDYVLSSGEYGDDCTWVYAPNHKSEAFTFFLNFTIEPSNDAYLTFFSFDADTGRQIGQMETAQLKVRGGIVVQTADSGWTQWVYPNYNVNHVSAHQTIDFHWQESAMATYTQIASTQTKFWIWGGAAEVYILNGGTYQLLTPIVEYETEWYYYLPEHHGDGWTQQSVTLRIVLLEPGVEYRLGIDSIDPDTGYSISSFPGAAWMFQT
ncbi:MAG: hypothetical protein ISF22_06350 [Methanomassiliicoccus sp.]|nr:hypothetical protein [Methanomassiliicoccus sp.]